VEKCAKQVADLSAQIARLEKQKANAAAAFQSLSSDVESLLKRVQAATEQLATVERERDDGRAELEAIRKSHDEQVKALNDVPVILVLFFFTSASLSPVSLLLYLLLLHVMSQSSY
jgi:chromosome segregation ATPase